MKKILLKCSVMMFIMMTTFFANPLTAIAREEEGAGFTMGSSSPSNKYSKIDETSTEGAFDRFFTDWHVFMSFLAGFATLSSILAFIVLMVRLANSADNPYERSKVLREILVVLVVAALTGAATVVFLLLAQTAAS